MTQKKPKILPALPLIVLSSVFILTGCASQSGTSNAPTLVTQTATPMPSIPVQFSDITAAAGIRFKHTNGAFGLKLMPETMGSGVALIDYDGDGYQDIFFVNSRNWTDTELNAYKNSKWSPLEFNNFRSHHPGAAMARQIPANRPQQHVTGALYHNNGNGTFTDVTQGSGLDVEMFGMGAAVGDYDNDGKPDLYVTSYGRSYLFHNDGGGKFHDVATQAGLLSPGWSTSAAWVDYDQDGLLDLFVCHYIQWTPATDIYFSYDGITKSITGPRFYQGEPSHLYHNLGGGRFVDVSAKARIEGFKSVNNREQLIPGKAMGVAICDYDHDSWPDILVANDMQPNFLYHNNKNGTFGEVAKELGVAVSSTGQTRSGMGIDTANLNHTENLSILVGNFAHEMLGVYQYQAGIFSDTATQNGVGPISDQFLTFGCVFMDYDNDTWTDILAANGHIEPNIAHVNHGIEYAERLLLYHNQGDSHFQEVALQSGSAMRHKLVARGLAYADIDLDGDLDVIISTCGGPATVLRNDGGNKNNSIRIVTEGTKSNRSGIGTQIEAQVGTQILRATVHSGSSYCSQSELPVTLGLGQEKEAQSITLRWLSGVTTVLKHVPANQIITVNENKGLIRQQSFFHH